MVLTHGPELKNNAALYRKYFYKIHFSENIKILIYLLWRLYTAIR